MSYQNDRIKGIPAPLPKDYDRQANFTNWEVQNPGEPPRGTDLDAEFNAVEQAVDETQARLQLIQRDDGAVANKSVGLDQLKSEALIGVNAATSWDEFTSYAVNDSVIDPNGAWYVALESHVSSDNFQDDLTAGKWRLLIDLTPYTTEAKNWATLPEDQPVPEGDGTEYSAEHHAAKALASEIAAQLAQQSAEDAETEAKSARNTAVSAASNAEDAEEGAEAARDEARDFVTSTEYEFVGDYTAGLTLTAYNQIVRDTSGEFWRVSGSETLPYTLTGAGVPEGGALVSVGDAALRQDLVQPVATFNNVADMKASTMLGVGQFVRTLGYYEPGDGGGNDYEIVASGTGTDDGGSFIDLAGSGLQAKGLFVAHPYIKQFGAVGDGVQNDTAPLGSFLQYAEGKAVDFGSGVYLVNQLLGVSASGTWYSSGATIKYSATSTVDRFFDIDLTNDGLSVCGKITFDGSDSCAKALYVGNNSSTLRAFSAPYITCKNVAKSGTDWAATLLAEGNFDVFDVSGGYFANAVMLNGAKATPGVAGCVVKASASDQYPRLVYLNNARAENVYAEGLDYVGDQDGFRIFGPDGAEATHPHKMEVFANSITGIDCEGRVIKTQCDYAYIDGVYIERNKTSSVSPWGIDVDVQTGGGWVRGVQAIYRNNVPVTTVLINSTVSGYNNLPTAEVDGVQIVNQTSLALREIVLVASRSTDKPAQAFLSSFRAVGLLEAFVRSAPVSGTTGITITMESMSGAPSLAAFSTAASGQEGFLSARAVTNTGGSIVPFWHRGSSSQDFTVSATDSRNWADDRRVIPGTENIGATRLGRVAPLDAEKSGTEILLSKELTNDEVWVLPEHGWNNDGLFFIKVGFSDNDYGIVSGSPSGTTAVALGSSFEVGGTSEPESGSYRVWHDGSSLVIANRSGSTRQVTVKALG